MTKAVVTADPGEPPHDAYTGHGALAAALLGDR
jgi:hypothetical protein